MSEKMNAIASLKLPLTRFIANCLDRGSFGLHLGRLILTTSEDVLTEHLVVSEHEVGVLDKWE